jgi:hypothetical protein
VLEPPDWLRTNTFVRDQRPEGRRTDARRVAPDAGRQRAQQRIDESIPVIDDLTE